MVAYSHSYYVRGGSALARASFVMPPGKVVFPKGYSDELVSKRVVWLPFKTTLNIWKVSKWSNIFQELIGIHDKWRASRQYDRSLCEEWLSQVYTALWFAPKEWGARCCVVMFVFSILDNLKARDTEHYNDTSASSHSDFSIIWV